MLKTQRFIVALCLLALAAVANASPPENADFVDPKAPCFRWPAVDYDDDGVYDRVDNCTNTPKGCTVDQFGCHTDADGDGVCDGVDQCPNTPAGTKVNASGCPEGGRAPEPVKQTPTPAPPPAPKPVEKPAPPPPSATEKQLIETGTLRLDNVYFETNSTVLLPESRATLDEVGRALERHPEMNFEVGGHTDTRGRAAYNLTLSDGRANAVRSYLLQNFNISADALSARGYGETQPITQERNEEELHRNRRVEITVVK